MTPRKPVNPDAITVDEAAAMLGRPYKYVGWLQQRGLLDRLPGLPSVSRQQVEGLANDPWLTAAGVARLIGLSTTRIGQLVEKDHLPFRMFAGRRMFRTSQMSVVANARKTRWHNGHPSTGA